jgi:hypothetical protein
MNDKGEKVDSLYADTVIKDSPAWPVLSNIYELARGQANDQDVNTALEVLRST